MPYVLVGVVFARICGFSGLGYRCSSLMVIWLIRASVGFCGYVGFCVLWEAGGFMSRSYRKYPIVKQERVCKRTWNRAVRNMNLDFSLRGSQYKRIMRNWNTWQYPWTLRDAISQYQPSVRFPTLDSWVLYWKRCCLWK